MIKYSPGPWRLESRHGTTSVLDGNGDTVCDDEEYYPVAVLEDNMRLISAAPDLLRLAKAINLYFADFDCPLRSEARAAIAKAEAGRRAACAHRLQAPIRD